MTKEQGNILGKLFGGMEETGKLAEGQENQELDKMGAALEKLKKEVDVQKLKKAVEQGNEVEIVAVLNPLEKLFKEVECPEAGFTDPDEINAKWLVMKERIVNWLIEAREKEARQPIDNFINEVSTLTNFPTKKEEANEFAAKLKETLQPKKLIFGSIIAGLIKQADSMRGEDGSDSFFGSILRSIADLLGGKDREKIEALTSEMAAAIKEKDWDLVEEKANALLEEDKDNKKAKKALALAEKKQTALAGKKERRSKKEAEAEKTEKLSSEEKIKEIQDLLEVAEIPVALEKADYEKVLKTAPINGDPETLKKVVKANIKKNGGIWMLNAQVKEENNLKEGRFKFRLHDFLIPTNDLKAVYNVLLYKDNERNIYQFSNSKNITPNDLRGLLDAVRTGEGLALYEKTEEEKKQDIPTPEENKEPKKVADAGKSSGKDVWKKFGDDTQQMFSDESGGHF